VLRDSGSECPQDQALQRDLTDQLLRLVATLPPREEQVVLLRFGLSGQPAQTLRAAGRRMGLSRERVRQIELRALTRLRRLLEASTEPAAPES
jgi:RNA polymerase sigma factor (sigma-70 family)